MNFVMGVDGVLRFEVVVCEPTDEELKRMILDKGHNILVCTQARLRCTKT